MMRAKLHAYSAAWLLVSLPAVAGALPPAPPPASPVPAPAAPTAATIPAVTIPAVTVAATPATANGAAAPVAAPAATAPVDPAHPARPQGETSLGASKVSVFFLPIQMQAVEDALRDYESRATNNTNSKTDLAVDLSQLRDTSTPIKIDEPTSYPVFYLSSIAYESPSDWSIWVSGHKITSHKNTTSLQVTSISPNHASFMWKPTYISSIQTRQTSNMLAPIDPVKNKLTHPSAFNFDANNGVITFTLRPNQSFVAGYMNTFEGFIASPQMPDIKNALSDANTAISAAPVTSSTGAPVASQSDSRVSPVDTIGNMSLSASRREIDAQLAREPVNKKVAAP